MIKGQDISHKEEVFLKQNYPNINQIAQETIKHIDKLKLALKDCNTDPKQQLLLSKEINYLDNNKDRLSKTEIKFKNLGIQQL